MATTNDVVITDGKPRGELARFVVRYSHIRVDRDPGFRLHVVPDAESHLFYPLSGALEFQSEAGEQRMDGPALIGPYGRPFQIKAWLGARFILALLARFSLPDLFGLAASRLADAWVPLRDAVPGTLADVPGIAAARLAEGREVPAADGAQLVELSFAMLDQALSDQADSRRVESGPRESDRAIAQALWDADPNLTVAALAATHGWTRRRMVSASLSAGGFTPKLLRQIARAAALRDKVLAAADGADLAGLSADCGYADQAHAIRDLSLFAGFTPALLRRKFPGIREGWLHTRTPE